MPKACSIACASLVLALLTLPALAAPKAGEALGTLTIGGKTTKLVQVYAEKQTDEEGEEYLVLLLADRKLEPGDRSPARLAELAAAGQVQGLRVLWRTAYDDLRWVPYHRDLAENGLAAHGMGVLDLAAFDDRRVEGKVSSKMLGQDWHFNVSFKADVVAGGKVEVERLAEAEESPAADVDVAAAGQAEADPVLLKRKLGRLGYEWKPESFAHAVKDADVEAVELFLTGGMSPDTEDSGGLAVLMYASMYCGNDPLEQREEVALALIAAKANVNVKDQNDSTPLIWAAQSCSPRLIEALIKAGANVNARAKGSATPLMMAQAMSRTEVVNLLKKAGAKP